LFCFAFLCTFSLFRLREFKRGCLRRAVVTILSASFHLLLGVWILIQVRTISYNLCACLLFAYALACTPCFWADLPICFFDFGERVASWLSREGGICEYVCIFVACVCVCVCVCVRACACLSVPAFQRREDLWLSQRRLLLGRFLGECVCARVCMYVCVRARVLKCSSVPNKISGCHRTGYCWMSTCVCVCACVRAL